MNISLALSAELERALLERAAAAGKDVSMVISEIVAESVAENAFVQPSPGGSWKSRLDAFARLHPQLDQIVDDSRESIYNGCGE